MKSAFDSRWDHVWELIAEISDQDPSAISNRDNLGSGALTEIINANQVVVQIFQAFARVDKEIFPEYYIDTIYEVAHTYRNMRIQASALDPKRPDFAEMRQQFVDSFNRACDEYFGKLAPVLALISISEAKPDIALELKRKVEEGIAAKSHDFERLVSEKSNEFEHLSSKLRDEVEGIAEVRGAADRVLNEAQESASRLVVAQQAVHFSDIALAHRKSANFWIFASSILLLLTLILSFASLFLTSGDFFGLSGDPSAFALVQFTSGKLLTFGLLGYGVYACARNYFANRHNAVVNEQKKAALHTFQALADSADSPAERDVILTHAATCIFGIQETGFSKAGEAPVPHSSVVEILRGAGRGS